MKGRILLVMLALMFAFTVCPRQATAKEVVEDGDGIIEPGEDETAELQRASQNPVSSMISLPFQNNTFFETGPKGKTQNILLIQPVIPFSINDDWNFIARSVIPLLTQPPFNNAQKRNFGLGNIQFQGFLSPKEGVGGWLVGFGPILEFPTNSGPDGRFGSDNFSAGPAFVALKMKGPWVYGGLITHLWSYAGSDPEVNTTVFQPFVNYNLKNGWYLGLSPAIVANWAAHNSQRWTIPLGGGIGRVFRIGKQPVNASVRVYHNVQSPRNGSDWQLQLSLQFLFPKRQR